MANVSVNVIVEDGKFVRKGTKMIAGNFVLGEVKRGSREYDSWSYSELLIPLWRVLSKGLPIQRWH